MVLSNFLTTLVYEISVMLTSEKNFFDSKDRAKVLEKVNVTAPVKEYLSTVSSDDFLEDLRVAVSYLVSPTQTNPAENKFLEAVAEFITENLSNKLDVLDATYAKMNHKDQVSVVEKLVPSNTRLGTSLKDLMLYNSIQEIAQGLNEFLGAVTNTPYVIVQTPTEISQDLKKEIRTELTKELKTNCLPIFQVNKNLIGGLRVFINGEVTDNSWLGRINFITQIKN